MMRRDKNSNDPMEKFLLDVRAQMLKEFMAQLHINELEERVYNRVMSNLSFVIDDQTGPALTQIRKNIEDIIGNGRKR